VVVPVAFLLVLVTEAVTSDHRSGPAWLDVVVVAAMALASMLRRRAPVSFLVVVSGLALALGNGLTSRDYATLAGLYTVLVPTYAVGSWAPRRRAIVALAAWGVAATLTGIAQHASGAGLIGPLMAAAASAGVGALVRSQRELAASLARTEGSVLAQVRALERIAVEGERRRLAEVHHAAVARRVERLVEAVEDARRLLAVDDPRFTAAVTEVEQGGRDALAGMRDVVGALREGDASDTRLASNDAGGPTAAVHSRVSA
jgi:signal transduction histidine kinase